VRLDKAQRGDLVAEQLAGSRDDPVENVLERRPVHDRALDSRQALEQGLAPEHPHCEGQNPPHGAEQLVVVGGEVTLDSRQYQPRVGLILNRHGGAFAGVEAAVLQNRLASFRDVDQRPNGDLSRPEATRRDHGSLADDGAELGAQGARGVFEALLDRNISILNRGHEREKLCECVAPVIRGRRGHTNYSTRLA
jgi:hypothetical protein